MQQPYGQPQTGAPQPYGGYTQPAAPQSLKPSWRGLKRGGGSPLEEFVGSLNAWSVEPSTFGGTNCNFDFVALQVWKSDQPFPYAEARVSLKMSDSDNSAWGKFGHSIATAMGVDIDYLDIDGLKGHVLHMLRHDNVSFGTGRDGQEFKGTVWELVGIVPPGVQPVWKNPAPGQPPVVAVPVIVPPITTPPVIVPPVVTPPAAVPVVVAPTPVVQSPPVTQTPVTTPAPITVPPTAVADPSARALQLLDGQTLASYFNQALSDPIIKSDPGLVNSILSNAFVATLVAQGRARENADGTYSVIPVAT